MASAARFRKMDEERLVLETAYSDALIHALRDCAGGRWGLFGQNDGRLPLSLEERYTPNAKKELDRIGEELVSIRAKLGFTDLYSPMQRLEELRSQKGTNQLGEPRLAELFLAELAVRR